MKFSTFILSLPLKNSPKKITKGKINNKEYNKREKSEPTRMVPREPPTKISLNEKKTSENS